MKKISDYRDEEALDLLADLIEPAVAIAQDKELTAALTDGNYAKAIKIAIKSHKPQVIEILARVDGVPVKDFHCNVATLPLRIMDILTDDDFMSVFTSPEATTSPSGSSD